MYFNKKKVLILQSSGIVFIGLVLYLIFSYAPIQNEKVSVTPSQNTIVQSNISNELTKSWQPTEENPIIPGYNLVDKATKPQPNIDYSSGIEDGSLSESANKYINVDKGSDAVIQINESMAGIVEKPYSEIDPIVDNMLANPQVRQEWLDWLLTAEDKNVISGTERLLSRLPLNELTDFASKSLVSSDKYVVQHTVEALNTVAQHGLDIVENGLVDNIVEILSSESIDNYAKVLALSVLSENSDVYSDTERASLVQKIEIELSNEVVSIQIEALDSIIKLDPQNARIENMVLEGVSDQDRNNRYQALMNLDRQLEYGLDLSSDAVSSIHYQVLTDLTDLEDYSGFNETIKKRYVDTATYILGNLDLTESQIADMQAAGLNYDDLREVEEDINSEGEVNDEKVEPGVSS